MLKRTPIMTRILVGANLAVYLIIEVLGPALLGPARAGELLKSLSLVPGEFWEGAIWQPITSMFLHAPPGTMMAFLHLPFNMLALWSIGMFLERAIGSLRYLLLYMFSGLTGALLVAYFQDPFTQTMGASGAVSGLVAAMAILNPNARFLVMFVIPVRAATVAIAFFVISFFFALTGDGGPFSHWGHLGGLVGGALYTWLAIPVAQARGFFQGGTRAEGGSDAYSDPRQAARERQARMLEEMMSSLMRRQGTGPRSAGSREKVINPYPDEPDDSQRRTEHPAEASNRKVFFDPITGRFYIRET